MSDAESLATRLPAWAFGAFIGVLAWFSATTPMFLFSDLWPDRGLVGVATSPLLWLLLVCGAPQAVAALRTGRARAVIASHCRAHAIASAVGCALVLALVAVWRGDPDCLSRVAEMRGFAAARESAFRCPVLGARSAAVPLYTFMLSALLALSATQFAGRGRARDQSAEAPGHSPRRPANSQVRGGFPGAFSLGASALSAALMLGIQNQGRRGLPFRLDGSVISLMLWSALPSLLGYAVAVAAERRGSRPATRRSLAAFSIAVGVFNAWGLGSRFVVPANPDGAAHIALYLLPIGSVLAGALVACVWRVLLAALGTFKPEGR